MDLKNPICVLCGFREKCQDARKTNNCLLDYQDTLMSPVDIMYLKAQAVEDKIRIKQLEKSANATNPDQQYADDLMSHAQALEGVYNTANGGSTPKWVLASINHHASSIKSILQAAGEDRLTTLKKSMGEDFICAKCGAYMICRKAYCAGCGRKIVAGDPANGEVGDELYAR